MKSSGWMKAAAFGSACLVLTAGARADVRVMSNQDSSITFQGEDVVITARDDSEARITPEGDLTIQGKTVNVTSGQRKLLQQYTDGIRDIRKKGQAMGEHAVDMVGGMLGTLVADLFSSDQGSDIDHDMKAKAEPLKDEARALCKDVRVERDLQDRIAGQIPAFKPYAVIDTDSDHDCHIDDNDSED